MLSQSEGGPRVCSSDEKECVDLAQVLGVARPTAWTSLEKVESDFGRWLPRLLTMARRLADLLMHTSGPEKLNRPHKNTQSAQPSNSPVRQKPVLTCTSRRHAVQLNASISRDSRTRFLITTRGPRHPAMDVHASHVLSHGASEHCPFRASHTRLCFRSLLVQYLSF